jgi:uncharacterized repeat protein (TIGR02543 family)
MKIKNGGIFMSKKLISVLLAVVMVITAAFGTMSVSAAELTNFVGDGGFENANFSGTILNFGTGGATEIGTWGRFSSGVTRMELVTSDNYGAEDSVALNGNQYMKSGVTSDGAYIRGFGQRVSLAAGDYIFTFIAKSDVSNTFSVGVFTSEAKTTSDIDKSLVKTKLDVSNTWKEYNLEFTVVTDGIYNIIIGGNTNGNNNIRLFYMDNVAIYEKDSCVEVNGTAIVGGTVTGGGYFEKGSEVTLTATAKSGYTFAGWSDGETSATRTVIASANVTYIANFTKDDADFVPNGDFESNDWVLSDYWTTLSGNTAFVETADPANANNTVAYAEGNKAATSMISKNTITLKQGHTYVIEFDSYMVSAVTGNGTNFYRVGFVKPGSADLAGASFVASDYASVYNRTLSTELSTWKSFNYKYTHNAADTEANIALGMYNNECSSDWYLDNIVAYDEADVCTMSISAENGTATASSTTVLKGEKVTLTATPEKEEYEFLGWYANGVLVSSSEVYEVALTENATFTAKYKIVIPPVYSVVNGDFEANDNIDFSTNITGSDNEGVWAKVGTGVNMFKVVSATDADPEFVGNAYALATAPAAGYVRTFGQFITLKANTNYVLEFAAKSNVVYIGTSPVYGAVIKRMSGSHGVTIGGGAANVVSASSYATISTDGEWHRYTVTFNSGNNTEVAVAFGGNATDSLMEGMYFAVDNVVLKESNVTTIGDFENGTAGWTTTGDATITTNNTADTALASFKKYLDEKVGVINPVNEGDTFTSPAFATEIGKTYDVVIYTRHNSADDTRGKFMFTANGEKENLSQASYGISQGESEEGRYENNDGFLVNPIPMGGTAKYQTSTFNKLILTFTATAESHNITITTVTPVSAFVDGFIVHSHSDAVELAENSIGYKGTAIRTTGVQGLRFKNSIAIDALAHAGNYAKVVEYGTLAIKEEYKDGEIIVENLTDGKYDYTKSSGKVGCRLKVGVAYNAVDGTDVVYSADLYNKDFTGVLIGINEEDYSSNYVTRVYAKVQFADGTYTYVYGDEQVANITAVAEHIVNNELETPEIRDYLNTNILGK